MKTVLNHLYLMLALLVALMATAVGAQAQGTLTDGRQAEACLTSADGHLRLTAEERQRPAEPAVGSGRAVPRVGASRPTRLLPTNGSRPGTGGGKWYADNTFHPFYRFFLRLTVGRRLPRAGAASPRYCYVIALRRLLC